MKLSFQDRICWKASGPIIPRLTNAEIDEVLREYRPTWKNPVCDCGGERVCVACILTQIIDQVRGDLRWHEEFQQPRLPFDAK
jgi:hypothetical protein